MKKFISLALASVMVVAMAAGCSSSTTEETTQETETTEEGTGEEGKVYKFLVRKKGLIRTDIQDYIYKKVKNR